jgi:hypothetical protein
MPRDLFQYLIEVRRIVVAAELAGGFDKAFGLRFRGLFFLNQLLISCCWQLSSCVTQNESV